MQRCPVSLVGKAEVVAVGGYTVRDPEKRCLYCKGESDSCVPGECVCHDLENQEWGYTGPAMATIVIVIVMASPKGTVSIKTIQFEGTWDQCQDFYFEMSNHGLILPDFVLNGEPSSVKKIEESSETIKEAVRNVCMSSPGKPSADIPEYHADSWEKVNFITDSHLYKVCFEEPEKGINIVRKIILDNFT